MVKLKRCNNCGTVNPSDASKCNHCTEKFDKNFFELFDKDKYTEVWACPKCRYINLAVNRTCGSCYYKS